MVPLQVAIDPYWLYYNHNMKATPSTSVVDIEVDTLVRADGINLDGKGD